MLLLTGQSKPLATLVAVRSHFVNSIFGITHHYTVLVFLLGKHINVYLPHTDMFEPVCHDIRLCNATKREQKQENIYWFTVTNELQIVFCCNNFTFKSILTSEWMLFELRLRPYISNHCQMLLICKIICSVWFVLPLLLI